MIWFCHWYPLIDYNSFWSCIGICTVSEKTWNLQILTQFREYIYNGLTLSLISVIQVKIRAPSGEWPRKAGWSSQAHYKVVQTLKTWIWKHTHKRCGRTNICHTGLVSWTCEELIRWYMRADWYCTQTRRGIKFKYTISHHWHRIGCGNHPIYHREERAIRKGGFEWKHLFFFHYLRLMWYGWNRVEWSPDLPETSESNSCPLTLCGPASPPSKFVWRDGHRR